MKNANYNDLEDPAYRFQLTSDEIIEFLDLKNFPTKRTGDSFNPCIFEVIDLNKTLKYISSDIVKIRITIDDIRLKLDLSINQTKIFTEKSFFIQIKVLLNHILIL